MTWHGMIFVFAFVFIFVFVFILKYYIKIYITFQQIVHAVEPGALEVGAAARGVQCARPARAERGGVVAGGVVVRAVGRGGRSAVAVLV